MIDNNEIVKEKISKNEALFGTVDSYLVWKLTNGNVHITDMSNASNIDNGEPLMETVLRKTPHKNKSIKLKKAKTFTQHYFDMLFEDCLRKFA